MISRVVEVWSGRALSGGIRSPPRETAREEKKGKRKERKRKIEDEEALIIEGR